MKKSLFILLIITGFFLLISCTGEEGPAGVDGSSIDAIPPTIVLDYPTPGATIGTNFTASASAVDNAGVDRVHFLLDGSDRINDTTYAVVFEEPYAYLFDFDQLSIENGPHTFQVKAFDLQGNFASSAPILFEVDFLPPSGVGVLRHWNPDSLNAVSIPDTNESGDYADYFIRFDIERTCIVDSVRFYLDSLAIETMNYDRDIVVELFKSNGVYPSTILSDASTTTLEATDLESVGFHAATFNIPDTLVADNRYHVVFRSDTPSDTTNMAIGTYVRDVYPFATDNFSGVGFSNGGADTDWQTFQEYSGNPVSTIEFLVEVWVRYL